jgi:hypothetical protein
MKTKPPESGTDEKSPSPRTAKGLRRLVDKGCVVSAPPSVTQDPHSLIGVNGAAIVGRQFYPRRMPTLSHSADLHAYIDQVFGTPDAAACRVVDVLEAQAAALAWVRDTTGRYPGPKRVGAAIQEAANGLRGVDDERNPKQILFAVAAEALAAHMAEPS